MYDAGFDRNAIDRLAALGAICRERDVPMLVHVNEPTIGGEANLPFGGSKATGVGPRDVTPEAVEPLFDKHLPGFGEILRVGSYDKTPLSIISRGTAQLFGHSAFKLTETDCPEENLP